MCKKENFAVILFFVIAILLKVCSVIALFTMHLGAKKQHKLSRIYHEHQLARTLFLKSSILTKFYWDTSMKKYFRFLSSCLFYLTICIQHNIIHALFSWVTVTNEHEMQQIPDQKYLEPYRPIKMAHNTRKQQQLHIIHKQLISKISITRS